MKFIPIVLILLSSAAFGADLAKPSSISFRKDFGVWGSGSYTISLEDTGVIRINRYDQWECRFNSDYGWKVRELSTLIPQEYKKFSSVSFNYCRDNHMKKVGFHAADGNSLFADWPVDKNCQRNKQIPSWLSRTAMEMELIYENTMAKCNKELVMISFSNLKTQSQLMELERKLVARLEETGAGEYEGYDILWEQKSDGIIYLYGESADKLYNTILPVLKKSDLLKKDAAARLIYEFESKSDRNRVVKFSFP